MRSNTQKTELDTRNIGTIEWAELTNEVSHDRVYINCWVGSMQYWYRLPSAPQTGPWHLNMVYSLLFTQTGRNITGPWHLNMVYSLLFTQTGRNITGPWHLNMVYSLLFTQTGRNITGPWHLTMVYSFLFTQTGRNITGLWHLYMVYSLLFTQRGRNTLLQCQLLHKFHLKTTLYIWRLDCQSQADIPLILQHNLSGRQEWVSVTCPSAKWLVQSKLASSISNLDFFFFFFF